MVAVGESEDWAVSEAVAEYEAYSAGKLCRLIDAHEVKGGMVQLCGVEDDFVDRETDAHKFWTMAYVRGDDDAVVPLGVGTREHVLDVNARLDERRARIWDPERFPPPVAVLGGRGYYFRPAHGRVLVGVAQVGARAVLLAAIGEQLGVLHLAGKAVTLVHVGRVLSFSEVDVDAALRRHRRPTASARRSEPAGPGPLRPSAATRAEHVRIVYGQPVDTNGGPMIAQVIRRCFTDVVTRALALRAKDDKELKGKTKVRGFVDVLFRLYLAGCGDLVGRIGQIIKQIQHHCPDFDMAPEALADVLGLLHASGTCLIAPREPGDRIWQVNLANLGNPRSRIHRRLCKETAGRSCASEAANERPSLLVVSDSPPSDGLLPSEQQGAQAPAAATPEPATGGDTTVPREQAAPASMTAAEGEDPIRGEQAAATMDDLVAALVKQLARMPIALQRLLLASLIVLGFRPPADNPPDTVSAAADQVEADQPPASAATVEPPPIPPDVDAQAVHPDDLDGPLAAPAITDAATPASAVMVPEPAHVPRATVPSTRACPGLTQVYELGRHLLLSRGSPGARPSLVIAGRRWTADGSDVYPSTALYPSASHNLTTVRDALAMLAGKTPGGILGPRGPPAQPG